jgi:hypothetical protein
LLGFTGGPGTALQQPFTPVDWPMRHWFPFMAQHLQMTAPNGAVACADQLFRNPGNEAADAKLSRITRR